MALVTPSINNHSRNGFNNNFKAIKCSHYKKYGHIKRNCPLMKQFSFEKKSKNDNVAVVEDNSDCSYGSIDVLAISV